MNDTRCPGCGRTRASADELARWKRELGEKYMGPEPAWARALCWTKPDVRCICKPIN